MSGKQQQDARDILNRLLALLADIDRIQAPHRRRQGSKWRVDSPLPPPLPQAPLPTSDGRQPPQARGIENWRSPQPQESRTSPVVAIPWVEPANAKPVDGSKESDPNNDEPPPNGGPSTGKKRTAKHRADEKSATRAKAKPVQQQTSSETRRAPTRAAAPDSSTVEPKAAYPLDTSNSLPDNNRPAAPLTNEQDTTERTEKRLFTASASTTKAPPVRLPFGPPVSREPRASNASVYETVNEDSPYAAANDLVRADKNDANRATSSATSNKQSSENTLDSDEFHDDYDHELFEGRSRRSRRSKRSRFIRRRKVASLGNNETKALKRRISACFLDRALRRVG